MITSKAYAPASIGNVSLGFDVLGAALSPIDDSLLGDWVEVSESSSFELTHDGRFAHKLPKDPTDNIVYDCYKHFQQALEKANVAPLDVRIHLHKDLPIGSGLGSSASSIVAAFYALNEYAQTYYKRAIFSQDELLFMMGELEGMISGSVHYDNVAPSFIGGLTLTTGQDSNLAASLPIFDDWYWVCCYSGLTVSTAEARAILPKKYALADALTYGRNLAVFTHALYSGNKEIAARAMQDVIAEPYRRLLLPNFSEAKAQCNELGALGFGISGSGPTVFAVCDSLDTANAVNQYLNDHYVQNEQGFSHICRIDQQGARTI